MSQLERVAEKYCLMYVHTIVGNANICGEQFSHDKRKHSECRVSRFYVADNTKLMINNQNEPENSSYIYICVSKPSQNK
jgi:hypothetical protein